MEAIRDFNKIKRYLKSFTLIAHGLHTFSCEKCKNKEAEECWYCVREFWYQFGAESVQIQDGVCQICKKNAPVTTIAGRTAVLDVSNEPDQLMYTNENPITKEITEKQKFLLSLCDECRIKEGGVETFEVVSITSP